MVAGHSTQEAFVGIETLRWLALNPLELGLFQLRNDSTHYARSDPILQIEDILEIAVEAVRPQMRTVCGIDELTGNAYLV